MFSEVLSQFKDLTEVFRLHGFKVYLVGGAVRNLLMGKKPKDFDFATPARPEAVQKMFKRVIPTGIKHGTVTVLWHNLSLEITTFRSEAGYEDHRTPSDVFFGVDLAQDLERRDFTINAMALDLDTGELFDLHGGGTDLKNKIIRTVGDPEQRFEEDALRILRAPRFAAQLGFQVVPEISSAAKTARETLKHLSSERIRDELIKIMASGSPEVGFDFFEATGIWSILFPGFSPLKDRKSGLSAWGSENPMARWAGFFCLTGFPEGPGWLRGMKFTNREIQWVEKVLAIFLLLRNPSWTPKKTLEAMKIWGQRELGDLKGFFEGLVKASLMDPGAPGWQALVAAQEDPSPVFIHELKINGLDASKFFRGRDVGLALQECLERVWTAKGPLDREGQLGILQGLADSWESTP